MSLVKFNGKALVWVTYVSDAKGCALPHGHENCVKLEEMDTGDVKLSLRDHSNIRHYWNIDKGITYTGNKKIDNIHIINGIAEAERKKSIELMLSGYNAACLFLNRGGNYYSFQRRMTEQELFLDELSKQMLPNTPIEFVHFCMTDTNCYDLVNRKSYSHAEILEKGINYWMRGADSVKDIWEMISPGSRFPSFLKLKLSDPITERPGSLYLIDLLDPLFKQPNYVDVYSVQRLFHNLIGLLDPEILPDQVGNGHLHCDNLLSSILLPFLLGRGKLTICATIDECPRQFTQDTIILMNLITKIRNIKSYCILNEPVPKTINNRLCELKGKYDHIKTINQTLYSQTRELLSENEGQKHDIVLLNKELKIGEKKILEYEIARSHTLAVIPKTKSRIEKKIREIKLLAYHRIICLKRDIAALEKKNMTLNEENDLQYKAYFKLVDKVEKRRNIIKKIADKYNTIKEMNTLLKKKLDSKDVKMQILEENIAKTKDALEIEYQISHQEKTVLQSIIKMLRQYVQETNVEYTVLNKDEPNTED